jgi:hypothetical protein
LALHVLSEWNARRQASWYPDPLDFFHYRDRDDFEVDIVLERGSVAVVGVEVKAAVSVTDADLRREYLAPEP